MEEELELERRLDTDFPYLDYEVIHRDYGVLLKWRIEDYLISVKEGMYDVLSISKLGNGLEILYSEFVDSDNTIDVLMDVLCSYPDIKAKERDYKINQMLKD